MTRFGALVERVDKRVPGSGLPLLSVSQTRGVIRRSELTDTAARAESLDHYKTCRTGDIVFNKMSVRAGAMGVAHEAGLVTYHYEVMRPRFGTDSRYVVYLMKSEAFTAEMVRRERGIAAGDDSGSVRTTEVPFRVLRTIDTFVPTPPEQRAIADYLDRETAQIDAFIAKNQELVAVLAERRDSLWTEIYDDAATSGELVRVRRLVASIVDGPFGSSLTSTHYSTSGTRVIRLGNIGINEFKHADEAFISTEYAAQLATHAARAGDVIVAGLGDERMPLGRACVLPDIGPAIVKADCYRVRPNRLASAEYLAWVLSAPPTRGQMRLLARGTTRLRLNTSVVRDVQVPVPSSSLQAELVARFGRRAEEIDAASRKAESGIDLARERRAALISAAVTGKIDVGVAA